MRTLGLSREEAAASLALPIRTLARRERQRRLRSTEADRLYRLAGVACRAVEVLGSTDAAGRWLRHPNRALGGVAPLELLDTGAGAEEVEHVLGRIEWGLYS